MQFLLPYRDLPRRVILRSMLGDWFFSLSILIHILGNRNFEFLYRYRCLSLKPEKFHWKCLVKTQTKVKESVKFGVSLVVRDP